MSHNIVMKDVRLKDMAMLASVVRDMSQGRATLDMNLKSFRTERMLGGSGECDACIKMPGEMDIGLILDGNAYSPVFGAMGMNQIFRARNGRSPIGGLLQEYALREAEYEAAQQGYDATRVEQPNGTITLELVEAA